MIFFKGLLPEPFLNTQEVSPQGSGLF